MKEFKIAYLASAGFGAIGLVLYLIVLGELIFSKSVSPAWTTTLKIIGLIAFAIALLILIGIVVVASIKDKKGDAKPQATDEELLSKYKSK